VRAQFLAVPHLPTDQVTLPVEGARRRERRGRRVALDRDHCGIETGRARGERLAQGIPPASRAEIRSRADPDVADLPALDARLERAQHTSDRRLRSLLVSL